jgi:hypothetical protein
MNTPLTRRRSRLARRFGWLVVAGLTTAALIGPSAGSVLANDMHQDLPISWDNPQYQGSSEDCADAGLEPGEVLWHFVQTQTDDDSGMLTATFSVAGVVGPVASYKHSGQVLHWAIITGEDTLLGATSDIENDGNLNLSHICGGGTTTTTSSSSTTTTSDSSSSTTTTTSQSSSTTTSQSSSTTTTTSSTQTPTPTPTPTPVPTPTPSPSPTGEVLSETGAPAVTLPPTDTFSGNTSAPAGDSWRLILLAMAGILAGTLVLTPNQSAIKRDDR